MSILLFIQGLREKPCILGQSFHVWGDNEWSGACVCVCCVILERALDMLGAIVVVGSANVYFLEKPTWYVRRNVDGDGKTAYSTTLSFHLQYSKQVTWHCSEITHCSIYFIQVELFTAIYPPTPFAVLVLVSCISSSIRKLTCRIYAPAAHFHPVTFLSHLPCRRCRWSWSNAQAK